MLVPGVRSGEELGAKDCRNVRTSERRGRKKRSSPVGSEQVLTRHTTKDGDVPTSYYRR
jgi:hypothetical protein